MATVPFTFRLDEDIKTRLEEAAKTDDRSASYVVSKAIKEYLNKQDFKKQALRAAIEQADKGEFVSQEAMRKWFASLGTDNVLPRPEPDVFLNAKN